MFRRKIKYPLWRWHASGEKINNQLHSSRKVGFMQ
nr:MAG TPA: hypothetical protein [Caudoviricetes sp.]